VSRRPALLCVVFAWAMVSCDDAESDGVGDGYVPLGTEIPPDGGVVDAPDAAPVDGTPLRLTFDPIEHDAEVLRLTDLAFLPAPSPEVLLVDKDGAIVHARLDDLDGDGGMTRLGRFEIGDTWFDSDAGAISIVLDPGFAENGFFYVGLTTSLNDSVIRRFTFDARDLEATAASGVDIFEAGHDRARRSWHNIGSIGFDDGGCMWALFGDKTVSDTAQNIETPLGALLRIHPGLGDEGGWMPCEGNAFADGSGHPAIFAYGFRSPWRGVYRDGAWYVGDVGLDDYEEVNRVQAAGENFGWPLAEGLCDPAETDCDVLVDPLISYGRNARHRYMVEDPEVRATGLRTVYTGLIYEPGLGGAPDRYAGRWNDVLTFGDNHAGWVRARSVTGDADWAVGHAIFTTGWAQGPDGFVYVTALGTWPVDAPEKQAPIYRMRLRE
jgi:hypothetical protein